MNEDFKARLARLEAKDSSPYPSSNQPSKMRKEPRRSRPSGGGGGSITKMILIGIACLIVLPVGATLATIYLPEIKGTADRALAFVDVSQEIGGDVSDEQRSADGVLLRMKTGTMGAKEKPSWKSEEDTARLERLQMGATRVDHDKLLNASKRLHVVE
jgi:hypothetical protein